MMNKVEERILRNRIPIDADEIFERFRKDGLSMTKERALNIATKRVEEKINQLDINDIWGSLERLPKDLRDSMWFDIRTTMNEPSDMCNPLGKYGSYIKESMEIDEIEAYPPDEVHDFIVDKYFLLDRNFLSYTNKNHTKIVYLVADAFDNIKLLKEDMETFEYCFSQKESKTIGGKLWCALAFAPITKIRDNFKDTIA